ncbi:Fic family protein (plasmid) [Mesorhizobium onobrychidis]|uniref:Fic family protein n=2 Tax=Mesorhizobium onobrychidis TaxID=2775404 RepID=A0ABY5R7I7_9HYPH|nr:Fic family protein [Mesorhizobium onobrychidis]
MTAQQIADALPSAPPRRTLQYRLRHLVDSKRLVMEGQGRWARYRVPRIVEAVGMAAGRTEARGVGEALLPLSRSGADIQEYVRRPPEARKPVGYDRAFLDSYRPNESFYLSPTERKHLQEVGTPKIAEQPAGTYAKQILNRLLIDLSWNSSRLEGNTYSLIDTKRLIDLGEEAEGKERLEAQMILNHKDAIEFLVGTAKEIGFNRYTILNLHALLANNLLADPDAAGRLRHIAVGIERSVFHPLEVPPIIEECFDQILATASAIADPFERAFFVMVQLPYLQPFDDVNKRVSRLSANIPLIKGNLSPLSFDGVPRETYTDAVLGVYELNRTELLRDVFIWAYERSAARYAAVRQSLGEPDPFRLRHRAALREVVGTVIRERMDKKQATAHVGTWTREHIEPGDRERFQETAENELLSLHEGNFARYQIRPSEFAAWQDAWSR